MKNMSVALALLLSLIGLPPRQADKRPEAKLVRTPFVGGDAMHAIQEAALDLKGYAPGEKDAVAIRVCSKRPLPVALSTATASPFIMLSYLEHYGFSRERVLFLRSEECLSTDPSVAVTEFWALPDGAAAPSSVDAVRASEVRLEVVRTGATFKGAKDYHLALQQLADKVHGKSDASGVVVGSYFERPSRALKSNLAAAKKALKKNLSSADRFYVLAAPDPGVHEGNEPEPNYPSLFLVEVARNGALR